MANEIIIGMSKVGNQLTIPADKAPRLAIEGSSGSGKTCMLGNILVQFMQHEPETQFIALDPKLTSLDWLSARAEVVTEPSLFLPRLRAYSDMVMRRYAELRSLGIAQVTPEYYERFPMRILIIEEAMSVFAEQPKGADKQILNIYAQLFSRIRAARCGVIMVSHSFGYEVLPTVARDQLDTRIIMRTASADMVKMLADPDEAPAHTLNSPGEFFFKSPETPWTRGKTWYTSELELQQMTESFALDKGDMGLDWSVQSPL